MIVTFPSAVLNQLWVRMLIFYSTKKYMKIKYKKISNNFHSKIINKIILFHKLN